MIKNYKKNQKFAKSIKYITYTKHDHWFIIKNKNLKFDLKIISH